MANNKTIDELEEFENSEFETELENEDDLEEETLAASSLKPGAKSISDPKSKIEMMQHVLGAMNGMNKGDLTYWFQATMSQFGPNKDYGVGDNSEKNRSTVAMKPSAASMKEDLDVMFQGEDLSEEFKENVSTLFEAAVNSRLIAESARLEEEYENTLHEELSVFEEQITNKLNSYLDYVVENWMSENEVAIESTLRNELMEEFIEGLKNLFSEHYISVPQEKVDVLEALADKVNALETKLDEAIDENTELRGVVLKETARGLFVELASDLALTQQEKFASLAEGIEFDGDIETYEKKLMIIKESFFKHEQTYSSNIEEETFEGETASVNRNIDPSVNRYVQAISRTIKK